MGKTKSYAIMGGLLGFVAWLGQFVFGEQFIVALTSVVFTAFAGAAYAVLTENKGGE